MNRRNDVALFLGSGPTINKLKEKDMPHLAQYDIWTLNNFIIHNFIVPDFWHAEIKPHRSGPLISRLALSKRELYSKTKIILNKDRPYLLNYFPEYSNFFFYNVVGSDSHSQNLYKAGGPLNHLRVSCLASITLVLELMVKMGYKQINFLGVDLFSGEYFWTNNDTYSHLRLNEVAPLLNSCKPDERIATAIHPTAERGIDEFISRFLEHNEVKAVNFSPNSLLSNHMETEDFDLLLS